MKDLDIPAAQVEHMRLGITSWTCRWAIRAGLDPPGVVGLAADVGAETVQFCENQPLWELRPTQLERLQASARAHGIVLELGTKGLDHGHLRDCIDLTARLGRRVLRLAAGTGDISAVESALRAVLPHARDRGITLALENQFDIPSAELARLVRRIGDPGLTMCLDAANSVGFLERPLETVTTLAAFATQFHIKDFVVVKLSEGYRIQGCPLGEGVVNVQALLNALRQAGRSPDVYLEQWMDPEDGNEPTLGKEVAWMRTGLQYMRKCMQSRE